MKVDRSKLKKTPTEAPADCRTLIEKLKGCSDEQLLLELQHIKTWNIGKCELYHWVDLLDRFDGILCDAGQTVENMSWLLVCDRPDNGQLKALLLAVLNFTALLIEYSFSRHLYSSIEHLTTLLASCDMQVVLSVLNLLYVFSKRSNYITRLGSDKRTPLLARLQHLAEKYPPSATTLHFEFYAEPGPEVKVERKNSSNTLHYIHIEQLDKISESPSEIMESLTVMYNIPKDKQTLLFTHIRLAHGFSNHKKRLQAVQARLHAISILVYSNALQESANSILYNGLIEELVDVLQITDKQLVDIKAASLRTLTSIVHLERTPKLSNIIDCTGTASYHGFLPVLVRNCIQAMIDPLMEPYPHQFATALFSFLYHLASYDAGGEALVSCGMMEALLKVIKFLGDEQDQITFVTRAVRVVDLITNLDMAAFQSHTGLTIFISRLEIQSWLLWLLALVLWLLALVLWLLALVLWLLALVLWLLALVLWLLALVLWLLALVLWLLALVLWLLALVLWLLALVLPETDHRAQSSTASTPRTGVQCIPQRAALLKSMLNFLKKAIQDPAFSDGIRHVMDGSLPTSLKHIISNAEYYGPSLFLLATEVVTVFVFQEPSLLSSLQDNGLTDVMLHALLIKDVPATREVLGSLPNVFSALCLNARGLHSFVQCQPFERLFKVLLSPDYLPAMRRRRSSDPLASNLGSAVDELMRHQPTLKTDATTAIIKKTDGTVTAPPARSSHAAEEASSEDEEEEEALHTFTQQQGEPESNRQVVGTEERIPIPLMDYILNVEFVNQKGLLPLVSILGLPNLPIDFPTSAACQAVAGVCKSILTLSHEPKVLQEGLCQLDSILSALEPLHRPIEVPGGSVLLRELATAGHVTDATLSARATPLLHALTAAHAYILMFVHTCRVGQSEIRAISVNQWGSQLGLSVLNKLSQLYCSLVWESTVLLSLCTPNSLPPGCEFGQADMQKLVPKEEKPSGSTTATASASGSRRTAESEAVAVDPSATGLLEGIGLDGDTLAPMETDEPTAGISDPKTKSKLTPAMATRIKQIKPLLSASSRLGRALAELFGLLVKLCVGSPVRQRRSHHATSTGTAPTPAARATASSLTKLLTKGLSWQPPPYTPTPRFRTFNWALSMGGKVPVSEGLEHAELPDGTGEFLDAWLMLVEKMVNPSTVLDSPHSLPVKVPGVTPTTPQFSALRFLIVTQKAAFSCIRSLWNRKPLKVYGGRMAESMLAILCHILRGEPVIQERLAKEREGTARPEEEGSAGASTLPVGSSSGGAGGSGGAPGAAVSAGECPAGSVPGPAIGGSTAPPAPGGAAEDSTNTTPRREPPVNQAQLQQGQGGGRERQPNVNQQQLHQEAARRREEDDRRARERTEEEEARCLERFLEAEPLDSTELHAFTDSMLPGCFHLLDELPDTVYRLCDLLMTAIKRSGPEYRDLILRQVVNQVWEAADVLIKAAIPLTTSDTKTVSEWTRQMATLPQASNLATRILLLTLLFEELKLSCARVVENSGILNVLIKLLEVVQPLLLIIDFYEKMAVSSKRRAQMNKYLQPNGNNWRWFDDRSGRWCSYSASNNGTIDSAWRAGESSRVPRVPKPAKAGSMTDSEREEGDRGKVEETQTDPDSAPLAVEMSAPKDDNATTQLKESSSGPSAPPAPLDPTSERTGAGGAIVVQGLTEDMTTVLIRACVSMISVPVVRSAVTSGAGSTTSGVVSGSLGSREINYILRVLGPAACRNPDCFADTANSCVRIALPAPRGAGTVSDDEFENLRIKGPNAVQLVKTTPLKLSPLPPIPDTIKEDDDVYQQYRLTRQGSDFDSQSAFHINAQVFTADGAVADSSQSGTPQGEASTPEEMREEKKEVEGEKGASSEEVKGAKPLMPTSTILRLLAELVRSYVGIATLIASYGYTAGQSELIKEDCSVLAFVLDHLLPHTQSSEDKDTPALARLFLASLAAAGTGTDAQVALVNEAVMCIISTIMESCPSTSSFYSTAAAKTQHNGMNNIIRLFLKKGLVNDLARVPHSLDLSSPNMANTVNAALKPLETLSRIVNQPSSLFGGKGGSSKNKTEHDTAYRCVHLTGSMLIAGDSGEVEGTLVEGSHRVQGTDSDLMDGETEGDTVVIAGQPEVLSTTAMQVENELVDLIDELLERDAGAWDVAAVRTNHKRTYSMNILEPEDEEHTQEEDSSGSNDDEDSQDEEEEEEEEEEEDQDDEEGDEDDDDEGSEMELDEDFPDINAAPHIRFERFDRDDDLIIEFDNMFSTTADIPPSPGNIPSSHPLMVRHADHGSLTLGGAGTNNRLAQGMGRSQRTLRQLTANTGHTIHVHYPGNRQPNPPLILQRLLGPSAAADILQLSSSLPLQSRGRARLLVGNEDVPILQHLETLRDEELEERRERRRRQLAEEEEAKQNDRRSGGGEEPREQSLQGSGLGTVNGAVGETTAEGEPQGSGVSCLDPPRVSEGFLTAPPSGEVTPTTPAPHEQALVSLETAICQQVHQPIADLLLAESHANSLAALAGAGLPALAASSDRPNCEAEASQMEMSPAPTIASLSPDIVETSEPAAVGVSQLEGSPMDTSSPASATQEEPVPNPAQAVHLSQELSGSISLPEGVDPSFLAALPEDIRREVLQNQLGIRPPARPPPSSTLPSTTTPDTGRRSRGHRELRRSVLEDMEDSVLAVMPPDIAAEAAALRREQEARQRQLMHERLFGHSSSSALSAILRSPAFTSRLGGNRGVQYTRLAVQRGGTFQMGGGANHSRPSSSSVDSLLRLRGRLLLDHEALSCLLVLLFVDEPKLNTSRLHRVLRNLCYHSQTRGWVIRSLLSILQRSSESEVCVETTRLEDARGKRTTAGQGGYSGSKGSTTTATAASSLSSSSSSSLELINRVESRSSSQLSWLSVSMDAALGCRTNIFQIQRASGRKHADRHSAGGTSGGPGGTLGGGVQGVTAGVTCAGGGGSTVHIHPQAAPVVCRHVLDTLIQLAKVFPSHFTQQRCKDLLSSSTSDLDSRLCAAASIVTGTAGGGSRTTQTSNTLSTPSSAQNSIGGGACGTAITPQSLGISTDFWDLLVKLDNMNVSRKGKASMKTVSLGAGGEAEGAQYSLEASPLGQLMNMLSHPVIRRSSLLTEKLLRLLSLISIALPDNKATEVPAGHPTPQSTTTGAGNPATATSAAGAPGSASASAQGTTVGVVSGAQGSSSTAIVSIPTSTGASATGKHRATVLCVESDTKLASTGLTEKQLQLSVEVLTSHSCSEEGLEDAANILLQLSRGDGATRDTVLRLLLSGARHLGYTLCKQIGTLLAELREYNLEQQRRARADAQSPDAPAEDTSLSARLKAGKLSSRFDGSESVVIVAAQKRTLGGRELQLPCMSSLTSKTSTQKFFLRVLQVIIQLREDTRRANKKAKQTGRLGSTSLGSASSIQAAVRQLEAEADAIIQMVREGQRARRLQQAPPPSASVTAVATAAGSSVAAPHAPAAAPGTASAATSSLQSEVGSVSEPQAAQRDDSPMDVDPAPLDEEGNSQSETEERLPDLPLLSEQLLLDELWDMLGECLKELEESHDQHAVLVLQPAVEAFFLVHATERESKPPVRDTRESQLSHIKDEPPPLSPAPLTPATPSSLDPFFSREPSSMHISSNLPPDTQKFLRFAETHRTVLNQILRQSTTHLADGPFAVLVDYIRILDFDELERLDEGLRKEDMAVHVRRDHVFEDSYRELHRKSPEDMKNRLYIVFEGEEGQDAGGLLREWYMIISREMFNAMYALFRTSPGDRVTYTINPSSHCNPNHLSYFKFVGRVVAKAVYDNRLLECYFTRSFYKHILGKSVRYTDMESEDYPFFQGLVYLLENDVSTLGYELTFSTEVQEFGVCEVRDLKPNGGNIIVTEENKKECPYKLGAYEVKCAIRKQLSAYLEGFYEIIPKRLISIFTEQELELLISGLPTIDIDDLKANTEYHKYQSSSIQIQWFWRALRSFDQADRAKFLQFVTGTSKVPLQGFAALEGMNGIQKFQIHRDDRSTDRLPFNQLDLPAYESYEKLRHMLLLAIQECSEGFGLA
ncbi:unnamed protein product [Coregonus sp. 'balchen']|nr:unnamed protein product [Coregonus sp. 'balchen']